jgi:hypothetical protein
MDVRLDRLEAEIAYRAIVCAIEENSITNLDGGQGHTAYVFGSEGKPSETWGTGPESNSVFKLMLKLQNASGSEVRPKIQTWQEFCKLVRAGYTRACGGETILR